MCSVVFNSLRCYWLLSIWWLFHRDNLYLFVNMGACWGASVRLMHPRTCHILLWCLEWILLQQLYLEKCHSACHTKISVYGPRNKYIRCSEFRPYCILTVHGARANSTKFVIVILDGRSDNQMPQKLKLICFTDFLTWSQLE